MRRDQRNLRNLRVQNPRDAPVPSGKGRKPPPHEHRRPAFGLRSAAALLDLIHSSVDSRLFSHLASVCLPTLPRLCLRASSRFVPGFLPST
ncbi:hypothetical protein P170DRAFT_436538, partial [Aspergillus steynii IBT 23096]